jgi:acetyltransferase
MTNQAKLQYGKSYNDYFDGSDGNQYHIRAINEEDAKSILLGFDRTSRETKLKRFLSVKKHLTEKELDYLSHPDFNQHYAYGIEEIKNGEHLAFGVARFVRDPKDTTRAECAITLTDEYQGKHLGSKLFEVMVNAAKEAGIKELYGEAFADNTAVFALMRKFGELKLNTHQGISGLSLKI